MLEQIFDRLVKVSGLSLWLFVEDNGAIYHAGRVGSRLYLYGSNDYLVKLLEFPDYTIYIETKDEKQREYRLYVVCKSEEFAWIIYKGLQ